MNLKISILILFIFNLNCFAQNKYYKVNGGKALNEDNYIKYKENLSKKGKIEEFNLKTDTKKDSIIYYLKTEILITTPDGEDPWYETKKNIGKKFPIEKFLNNNSNNLNKNYLIGKPTLINFWFTNCPPCIDEMPLLNQLKEKYGEKVNFISITFDNQKAVNDFLKKYKFNYQHITNSQKQIDELKISAYPTSFILDKNGIIKTINGEISKYEFEEIESTLNILL